MSNMLRGLSYSLIALLFFFLSCTPQRDKNDWLIIPGERVGQITKETSEQQLIALFGKDNVIQEDLGFGEDEITLGTIVYPDKLEQRFAVVWKDSETRNHAMEIHIYGETSKWHTRSGIRIGTTLAAIEKLNRRPFKLAGFGWDYSGAVCSMNGGELDFLEYDPNHHAKRKICLKLAPDYTQNGIRAMLKHVMGDKIFSSDHPIMQALNPKVTHIEVSYCN